MAKHRTAYCLQHHDGRTISRIDLEGTRIRIDLDHNAAAALWSPVMGQMMALREFLAIAGIQGIKVHAHTFKMHDNAK